ncbi:Glu/Leu/Phe/Val dehydrogenase [Candidatus Woesearchaeota archaeon]|nr:Glu/Leu/Phe/Val dehydrogenase [Candidatus Woesearchaeota archaeon]
MEIFELMAKAKIKRLEITRGELPPDPRVTQTTTYPLLREAMNAMKHKKVVFFYDSVSNMRSVIAIHNLKRGPALGGFRQWAYNSEWEALHDVLRLSRGMTYKSAAINFPLGGGKAISWLDAKGKTPAKLKAFARALVTMNGEFITGEDVGTTEQDIDFIYDQIKGRTKNVGVICYSKKKGSSGDPSPFTAIGVVEGMKLCAKYKLKKNKLKGVWVALQGPGNVGFNIAKMLINQGAKLYVTALHKESVDKVIAYAKKRKGSVQAVKPDEIYGVKADIFCPCALGAVLNPKTIPQLKCKVVAGSANNQLEDEERDGEALLRRGILYAPDYIINAGGLINAGTEAMDRTKGEKYSVAHVMRTLKLIPKNLKEVFELSRKKGISTVKAANILTEERLQ